MPFGICNATFQQLMEHKLLSLQWKILVLYLDNMVVHVETVEEHLKERIEKNIKLSPFAKIHISRRSFYRVKKKYYRPIDHGCGDVIIHESVKQRWNEDSKYRPKNLVKYEDGV